MNPMLLRPEATPFGQYAQAMAPRRIDGQVLKFAKGDFVAGPDAVELTHGTQAVVVMGSTAVGWQRWQGGRPTDSRLGLIADGFRPASRRELGDDDTSAWETDMNGDRRDPWQFVNSVVLMTPDAGRIFTFTTSSRGGIDAVAKLCAAYDAAIRRERGVYPLVALETGSYVHRDRALGRIKFPVFRVIEFVGATRFDTALALSRGEPVSARVEPAPPMAAIGKPLVVDEGYDPGCDPNDAVPF
jgi:hypothetical protein